MVVYSILKEGNYLRTAYCTVLVLGLSTSAPRPPKSEFYQTMQEYFGGKVASEITPDTVCYGVFLCFCVSGTEKFL